MLALNGDPFSSPSLLPNALALACKLVRSGKANSDFTADFVASVLVALLAPTGQTYEQPVHTYSWLLDNSGPPLHTLQVCAYFPFT